MLLRALTRAQKKAYAQHKIGQWRRRTWKTTALHIDRRGHLERSWQKQKVDDEAMCATLSVDL